VPTDLRRWAKGHSARRFIANARRGFAYFLVCALGLAVLSAVVIVAVKVPQWQAAIASIQDAKDRITLENEILKNVFQVLGGTVFLVGVYFTWRNLGVAQEGQITQRFNDAIEHLGSDKAEVRLGGIYALARIARDSPKDHSSVMRVFCSYVRETTKRTPAEPVTAEVQAILTMIARRTLEHESDEDEIDLSEAYIPGVNLRGAQLEHVRLDSANLSRAALAEAFLRGAALRGAIFEDANLRNADLRETDLTGADLRQAVLRSCLLDKANIFGAKLNGATLLQTDLSGVKNAIKRQIAMAITDETTTPPVYDELVRPPMSTTQS
jgi:hypothetical protein